MIDLIYIDLLFDCLIEWVINWNVVVFIVSWLFFGSKWCSVYVLWGNEWILLIIEFK